ncbi:MAG: helix-turn-helix domain-containing protein [Saprospiraceae bacterium]|nr:helix-turn-helix domain-containing protein [Saprospiraceae bacterium]
MKLKLEDARPDQQSSFRLLTPKLNDRFYWHYHPEYELIFIEGADGNRHIGDHISKYEGSDLAFIGPYLPHLNFDYGLRTDYEKVVLQLRQDFLGERFMEAPELSEVKALFERAKQGIVFHGKTKLQVGEMMRAMTQARHFRQLLLLLDIFQILATSNEWTPLGANPIEKAYDLKAEQRMKQVHYFVAEEYARKITILELAKQTYLSEAAFCRFFKKMNGITFTEYLNRYRVHQAKQLLHQGHTVTDACFQCGFESLSYFNKTFKKLAGLNPLQFKQQVRGVRE